MSRKTERRTTDPRVHDLARSVEALRATRPDRHTIVGAAFERRERL